jgi:hypothetical protein
MNYAMYEYIFTFFMLYSPYTFSFDKSKLLILYAYMVRDLNFSVGHR